MFTSTTRFLGCCDDCPSIRAFEFNYFQSNTFFAFLFLVGAIVIEQWLDCSNDSKSLLVFEQKWLLNSKAYKIGLNFAWSSKKKKWIQTFLVNFFPKFFLILLQRRNGRNARIECSSILLQYFFSRSKLLLKIRVLLEVQGFQNFFLLKFLVFFRSRILRKNLHVLKKKEKKTSKETKFFLFLFFLNKIEKNWMKKTWIPFKVHWFFCQQ